MREVDKDSSNDDNAATVNKQRVCKTVLEVLSCKRLMVAIVVVCVVVIVMVVLVV